MTPKCKKMKTDNKPKTYLDLLPDEIVNLIYRRLLYSIVTSRDFEVAQAWMYHRIVTKKMSLKQRHHYTHYLEDLI